MLGSARALLRSAPLSRRTRQGEIPAKPGSLCVPVWPNVDHSPTLNVEFGILQGLRLPRARDWDAFIWDHRRLLHRSTSSAWLDLVSLANWMNLNSDLVGGLEPGSAWEPQFSVSGARGSRVLAIQSPDSSCPQPRSACFHDGDRLGPRMSVTQSANSDIDHAPRVVNRTAGDRGAMGCNTSRDLGMVSLRN